METKYKKTVNACFTGYVVQAIVNNFAPLLFLLFNTEYAVPLEKITLLVTMNFGIQLLVDLLSVKLADRIGYRACLLLAHAFSALGMILLAFMPDRTSDPFAGMVIATVFYALGGGLLEVVVSPVMEACPTPNKEKAMSLLHSFYCWGHVAVVLLSTAFFTVFGIRNWKIMALLWALVPAYNLFVFIKAPIAPLIPEGQREMGLNRLIRSGIFWILMLLMICSGACEQAVSQWASAFAEKALGVNKTVGDLTGPMLFAILMGTARAVYGKFGDRLPLKKCIIGCTVLCIFSYLLISLTKLPVLGLIGCGLCGFSVGIMWPGTFSMACKALPAGGTAMFALLALGGDIGCSGGPTWVGLMSGTMGDDLQKGILTALIFPVLMLTGYLIWHCYQKTGDNR